MKIEIKDKTGVLEGLKRRLELEGDEFVEKGGEIVLSDHVTPGAIVIAGENPLPKAAIEALGFERETSEDSDFEFSRYFSSERGWGEWTVWVKEMRRLWSGELGPASSAGAVTKLVDFGEFFERGYLGEVLREMEFEGIVTLGMDSRRKVPVDVCLGAPGFSIYNILESAFDRVSDWTKGGRVHPTWTVGLVYSRYPWPMKGMGERAFLEGLGRGAEQHFWEFGLCRFRNTVYTDKTLVGYATGWGRDAREATLRALRTCRWIKCVDRQYRIDGENFTKRAVRFADWVFSEQELNRYSESPPESALKHGGS